MSEAKFSLNGRGQSELDGQLPFIDILVLAALAGFIIWRLRGVLGRREGHEQPNPNPFGGRRQSRKRGRREGGSGDNVVPLPGAENDAAAAKFEHIAPQGSELAHGLTEVQLADRQFDVDGFLSGARQAYEMIVTAFAGGDRPALRPLLSDEVYGDFDSALDARESEGQTVESTFIGLNEAELTGAEMRGHMAELTIRFVSELISLTKNTEGVVIEGDPS
ncbi:Tim44 domain-containing protein, partial [bacterium AH-315-P15]|nr:Tim44 domain-containing protein [bacterium AH-315-P15]